jgi:hypothetical protein
VTSEIPNWIAEMCEEGELQKRKEIGGEEVGKEERRIV